MSTATDLLASGLGSLRRVGLLLAAVGVIALAALASGGTHHVDGGGQIQPAQQTIVPSPDPAP
jgi:hypothetical protein